MFIYNGSIKLEDVFDGTSNTLMVGERTSEIDHSTWVGVVHGVKFAIPRIVGSASLPPNHPDATFEHFSSHHPAGAQFVFCDGSVRMIKSQIQTRVFHALATRAGNEVIDGKDL